jgi:hypothetical protein
MRQARQVFFFEKQKQKTFDDLASVSPERLWLDIQRFFGSFFQKRTPFFLPLHSLPLKEGS